MHGSRRLVRPAYSYWTLGYLLSNRGARKLLEADPFHSFLPVDEYFPILFGKHPQYVYCVIHAILAIGGLVYVPAYYCSVFTRYIDCFRNAENSRHTRLSRYNRKYCAIILSSAAC